MLRSSLQEMRSFVSLPSSAGPLLRRVAEPSCRRGPEKLVEPFKSRDLKSCLHKQENSLSKQDRCADLFR